MVPRVSTTDLLSPRAVSDPHAVYAGLRETGPIVWLPEHRGWFFSTYEAVQTGFRDDRLSSDRLTPMEARLSDPARELLGDTFELLRGWMVFHDGAGHERLRRPIRHAFTPRTVERLRPFVEATVDACLDDMLPRLRDGETVDLVDGLAFPLPAIVIAELLGIPHSDRDEFRTWSNQLAAIVFGTSSGPGNAARAAAGAARFADYFTALLADRAERPGDDLVSALLASRSEAQPPLSASELVGACTLLLFGGHETTTSLIGNSVAALLTHPAEWAWLCEHPDAVGPAGEELHRFDGPTKVMIRVVAEDHERHGVELHAGQTVYLGVAAANRDPAAFDRPDDLVLDRSDAHRHLGYGHGIHACLGAALARLESQVALDRVARRLDGMTLAIDGADLAWGATLLGRGLTSLPVAWSP